MAFKQLFLCVLVVPIHHIAMMIRRIFVGSHNRWPRKAHFGQDTRSIALRAIMSRHFAFFNFEPP